MTSRRRWLARAGAATLVAAGAWGLSAGPASAHNYLIGSSPSAGTVVTEQPDVISVTTNDNLLNVGGLNGGMAMEISSPGDAGKPLYFGDGCVTVFGPSLEAKAQLGPPGTYTVTWQVVSTDGHSVSGDFDFTWKPAPGQQLAKGSTTVPDCGATAPAAAPETDAAAPSDRTAGGASLSDVAWIGGAVLVVVIALAVTLVLLRRKPGERAE